MLITLFVAVQVPRTVVRLDTVLVIVERGGWVQHKTKEYYIELIQRLLLID